MLSYLRDRFPAEKLDSKTTQQGLIIVERVQGFLSRDRAIHLGIALLFTTMIAGLVTLPDELLGGPDAGLIRLLTLPAFVLLAYRSLSAFWHDWRNVLLIEKNKRAILHYQVDRHGYKSGMLRISFDDLTTTYISGLSRKSSGDAKTRVRLIIRSNGNPGRLLALQGSADEILVTRDLIMDAIAGSAVQKDAEELHVGSTGVKRAFLRAFFAIRKADPLG